MGFTPPPNGFNGGPGGDYSQFWPPPSDSLGGPPTTIATQIVATQTVSSGGELLETTKYVTSYETFLVNSASASTAPTNTNVVFPVHQDTSHGLTNTHLAVAVGFPAASIFVLCLFGIFLLNRRRQKKRAKEAMQGEMAGVTGLSRQPPLAKVSAGQSKDSSSHQSAPGLPPMDLEQPAPVAFPSELSRNDSGSQPFSYAGYFSGIDTSAPESQHTPLNGLSYRATSPEPPPPYAPRSDSAISRSNSACLAHPRPISAAYRLPHGGMASHQRPEIRSPFADPDDDDAESQAPSINENEVIRRRGADDMSVVSNASDRDRETLAHQMV